MDARKKNIRSPIEINDKRRYNQKPAEARSSLHMRGKQSCRGAQPLHRRIIPAHAGQTARSAIAPTPFADHPRACGANDVSETFDPDCDGSSPRMRGKHTAGRLPSGGHRIIPAHAGQTARSAIAPTPFADHPRACGANADVPEPALPKSGSSPRMRGKPTYMPLNPQAKRIIPAHAGQTLTLVRGLSWGTDHPRACGANASSICSSNMRSGSSPRMRGKPFDLLDVLIDRRIIPAHAGQTRPCPSRTLWWSDHPRACGANPIQYLRARKCHGSSPRMRGKRQQAGAFVVGERITPRMRGKLVLYGTPNCLRRIIPAHAGQTHGWNRACSSCSDHPRACGANLLLDDSTTSPPGSSPRMRGKLRVARHRRRQRRIIPAHAGQTRALGCRHARSPDHPRACGANRHGSRSRSWFRGSSPRMRGKHGERVTQRRARRIIPAHAGQTQRVQPSLFEGADHPRACGANPHAFSLAVSSHGSSPRMRGKRWLAWLVSRRPRIIPAHAGQTRAGRAGRRPAPDHPRACGANDRANARLRADRGSSPRMRGKRSNRVSITRMVITSD